MSIDIKLQSIYKSLVDGDYLSKFDALTLSGVDLDDRDASNPDNEINSAPIALAGLSKLGAEIEKNLISECIHEQSLLIQLNEELVKCDLEVQSNVLHKFTHTKSHSDLGWNTLPPSSDELSDEERDQKVHQLKNRIQELHAAATHQLGTKCYVYKKIHEIYELYLKMLLDLSTSCGVLNAGARSKIVVDSELNKMLSHKFISAETLVAMQQKLVLLASDLMFYGTEGPKYANHQLMFKSVLQLNATKTSFLDFGVSFRVGCVFMLMLWAAFEVLSNELNGHETWLDPSFTIFISIGLMLLLLWTWGGSLCIWRFAGINFIRVLGLEETSLAAVRRPENTVLRSATDLTFVYLLIFILFNTAKNRVFASDANPWIAHSLPVVLLLFFLYRMVMPWSKDRQVWWAMIAHLAQTTTVSFRDGYVGDILTSLVRVFLSLFFAFSYTIGLIYFALSTNPGAISTLHLSEMDQSVRNNKYFRCVLLPIITLLPLKIRLIQCLLRAVETGQRWPHFGNAVKYATCAIVVTQGLFNREVQHEAYWLICLFLVTMFQFLWDIMMDWGILTMTQDGSLRIRSSRYIGPTWVYFAAVFVNLILRFAWILTLIQLDVTNTEKEVGERKDKYVFVFDYLHPVTAGLEIARRMMWGLFRVEFEQIESIGLPTAAEKDRIQKKSDNDNVEEAVDAAPISAFEKMEISGGSEEFSYHSNRNNESDNVIEYFTHVLFDWSEYLLKLTGRSAPPNGIRSAMQSKRLLESAVFLALFLLSIVAASY